MSAMPNMTCNECKQDSFSPIQPSSQYPGYKYMKCQSCGNVVWLLNDANPPTDKQLNE